MIQIKKLDKYFHKGRSNENHVLKEIDLELPEKGLVCILGESGSGKTTLLNTIGGLDTFGSGSIAIDDTVLEKYDPKKIENLRNQKFGYIFQNYYLLQDYTVAYNIRLALNVFDLSEEEKDERVDYVLDALNMKKFKKKLVSQLSGGQQQRVSIARALVRAPEIILADEPTGNLDEENTIRIMSILKSISKECLVILVSHEKAIAKFFADRIIEIQDGVIRKDYANKTSDSYQRMDDSNIYLKEMDVQKMAIEEMDVSVFWDREEEEENTKDKIEEKIHLNLAWKDGKLYIQSPENVPLVLAGEESGVFMLDEKKPKLEHQQVEEISYDLPAVKAKKSSTLPRREIWKLALENIQLMGKKHKFMVGILLATSIMLVLALADYMMQRSVDLKTVVTEDSHYVTVQMEATESVKATEMRRKLEEFCEKYVTNGKYKDVYVSTTGVLNVGYDGFKQIKKLSTRIQDYSVVSVKNLKEEDLVMGRMPKHRNEFVVDRWLLEKMRDSGSIIGTVYNNDASLLNMEIGTIVTGLKLKLVGIVDNQQPSIYVYDTVALGMSYVGHEIMTDAELKEMFPGEYDDVELTDTEAMMNHSKFGSYEHQLQWNHGVETETTKLRQALPGVKFEIVGHCPDNLGVEYVVSQANYEKIRLKYILDTKTFKVYAEDVDEAIQYFKEAGKDYTSYFEVKPVSNYRQQLEEYEAQRKVDINAGYLVTLAVSFLSLIMVYFTIKSNAMARSEELTVYRLIGISAGSIIKAYMLEMILVTTYTCVPAILVTSGIIKFITSIPSLQFNLLFPWWLALVLIVVLYIINAVISILPVRGILRKPPAQLAVKNT